jgi:hypothetical protein
VMNTTAFNSGRSLPVMPNVSDGISSNSSNIDLCF